MPIEQNDQQVSTREELLLKLSEQRKALINLLLEGTSIAKDGNQTLKEKRALHQEEIKRLEELLASPPPPFEENQTAKQEDLFQQLALQQQSLGIDKIRLQIENSKLKTIHKRQALETEKLKLRQLRLEVKRDQLPVAKERTRLWITRIAGILVFVAFILISIKALTGNSEYLTPMTAIITTITALVVKGNITIDISKEKT